jgi:hypothetical protein
MSEKLEKKKKLFFHKSKKKNSTNNTNNSLSLNELISQLIVHHIGIN